MYTPNYKNINTIFLHCYTSTILINMIVPTHRSYLKRNSIPLLRVGNYEVTTESTLDNDSHIYHSLAHMYAPIL